MPVSACVFAVDGLGLCTPQFSLISARPSTTSAMSPALSLTLHGRPTALKSGALGHGITPPAYDSAASGGQGQFHINNVNVAPILLSNTVIDI